jgi:hypothetical protein
MKPGEILTPVGRLVSGHPMEMYEVIDDKTKKQKTFADGSPMFTQSVGIAFPKNGTQHWEQTEWGSKIKAAAVAAYPNGLYQHKDFSWKITDGDSTEPNKKMVTPVSREGYAGHWVLFASSCFPTPSYHAGRYQPHEVIKDKNEIKKGDYVRLVFSTAPNNSSDSPGMYINPVMLELSRAGQLIVSANAPDANAAFGTSAPVIPQGALIDSAVVVTPAMTPPAVAEDRYIVQGKEFTRSELLAMAGWTEAHLVGLTKVAPVVTTPVVVPPTPAPVVVTPAHDLVQPIVSPGVVTAPPVLPPAVVEQSYIVNGTKYTETQLLGMPGWTEAHLVGLTKA